MDAGRCSLLLALLLGTGCSFGADGTDWTDQLSAAGPCWRVDLANGLDTSSTDEIHDLFDCVNRQGAIDPLGRVVAALDAQGRAGVPLGLDLAGLVNSLPSVDVDPFALAGAALDLFEAQDSPIQPLMELLIELVYGRPYTTVATSLDLGAQDQLDQGVIPPLLPVVQSIATAILDNGDGAPALLADVIDDQVTADLTCTVVGLATTEDATAAALGDAFIDDLGDALVRVSDTSNDRWVDASGNSLRDVLDAFLVVPGDDGQTALTVMRADLLTLAADPLVIANLRETLQDAVDQDRLAVLPAQLLYLSQVDAGGNPLSADEDSALLSLLRLLDNGNTDLSCSVDLIVTQLSIDLGNLSVAILSALADQDPQAAADGVGIMGTVLGWGLTETTLDLIADSGACPVIDAQMVDDLQSIDRLSDDELGDLLVVLLMVLDDVQNGEDDRLVQLVDLASDVHGRGLVPPLEGAITDLGGSPLARDLSQTVGLLLDPSALDVDACPTGARPLDFEGLAGLLRAALQDRLGGAPVDVLNPLIQAALGQDQLWTALTNLGTLARSKGARLGDAPDLFAAVVQVDPQLDLVRDLAPILAAPALLQPALRVVENDQLIAALGAPSDQIEGVLPWGSRLVVDGTLDAVLRTVEIVIDALRASTTAATTTPATKTQSSDTAG
ncbi:MAG: hypothetical protein GXP62_13710 [Oligoflexia bacterium]|nr:hypothetical protein [Oligoflexia bacterium]